MSKMPTLEDFEAFSSEEEGEALAAAANGFRVLHLIDRDHPLDLWIYSPTTKNTYRLPLDIPLSSYIELMSDDGLESIEGFRKVLRTFSPDDAEKLESESPVTVTGMLKIYGEVFSKVQGAALGE